MRENNDLSLSDLSDSTILRENESLLSLLLKDHTTGKNIKWGTDSYINHGYSFRNDQEIKIDLITGWYEGFIRPRVDKDIDIQLERQRNRAEVFTPSWVIKLQVDAALEDMKELPLADFIQTKWLEITCGEAPYMVNRYDVETGEVIPLKERSGFIDVKFKKLNEATESEEEWLKLAVEIYKASYGYEYQGDSLLLARENLILTFIDNYFYMFGAFPKEKTLLEITKIISLNVFQMDGLTYEVPYSDGGAQNYGTQLNLFEEIEEEILTPRLAKIKLWDENSVNEFQYFLERNDNEMKFDVVIGNPPYQGEKVGDKTSPPAIYNFFMEESYKIGSKVCLITPARFLFNTGRTPKKWNRKMLHDQHLKVLNYESDSSKIFSNTIIKGGVVVTYRDKDKILGPISTFTAYPELNTILKKTEHDDSGKLSEITYSQAIYKFTDTMHKEKPETLDILSKGNEKAVGTGVLNSLNEIVFLENKPDDGKNYIKIAGLYEKARVYRWVKKEYINNPANLDKWKVLLPQANGSGTLGEVLSSPIIGKPLVGHTQTFISIGAFNTKEEAQACLKYIKTKFARVLLGVLKATQHNPPRTWSKIPLQDFTKNSGIDWSKSISEIDQQLFKKYSLNEEEINFIEKNVKEME